MEEFKFSPEKGFLDSGKFPDPGGEVDARTQLQALHNQTRDYINSVLIPEIQTIEGATGDADAIAKLSEQIKNATQEGAAKKAEYETITLLASGWVDGVYTIEDSRITETSEQDYSIPSTDTEAQIIMIQRANIQDAGQSAGQAKLKAWGEVPTADLPVTVIFRG